MARILLPEAYRTREKMDMDYEYSMATTYCLNSHFVLSELLYLRFDIVNWVHSSVGGKFLLYDKEKVSIMTYRG